MSCRGRSPAANAVLPSRSIDSSAPLPLAEGDRITMRPGWHARFHRVISWLYFDRVTVTGREHLPGSEEGPVLFLCLHRNGAVDAFVYHALLAPTRFMVSVQLCRSWFGRLFFSGIEVVRDKDRAKTPDADRINQQAMQECQDLLARGGRLTIFPEGTSTLGPRHLPFRAGASHLILEHLKAGRSDLKIIPLGIHYEEPSLFQRRVEVVIGPPVPLDFEESTSDRRRLLAIKERTSAALEAVGINVATEQEQEDVQRIAFALTLGTQHEYFAMMKQLERGIPTPMLEAWRAFQQAIRDRQAAMPSLPLVLYQGIPLFPIKPVPVYVAAFFLFGALWFPGLWLNLPPLLVGWLAARKMADDLNVVSLWKIMVGVPAFLLWGALVVLIALLSGHPGAAVFYLLATLVSQQLTHRFQKVATAVNNALRHPELRRKALAFHQQLIQELDRP